MTAVTIGALSILVLVLFIYSGLHVPIAMIVVSVGGIWLIRGNLDLGGALLAIAAVDAIESYVFSVVPLFVLMGLLVMISDLGKDAFAVARQMLIRVPGNLGVTTVGANAIFAAITGISIASATVFTKLAVPEMIRHGYSLRFAVGVVAGSSVLGMLIPPSVLFIIYGLLTSSSIGDLFIAAVIPGIVLAAAFGAMIVIRAIRNPAAFGGDRMRSVPEAERLSPGRMLLMLGPIALLIVVVLGGLYGGVFTATESGAVGALGALLIALAKRRLDLPRFWRLLLETGHVTASLLILIIAASLYSRMLSLSGLPGTLSTWVIANSVSFVLLLCAYLLILLLLGMIMDSASIMLVVIPLFLPVFLALGTDLVWLGVLTVLVVEIGLLTPPFGLAAYVVKSTLDRQDISLTDIFLGALPFATVMAGVAVLIAAFPQIVRVFL